MLGPQVPVDEANVTVGSVSVVVMCRMRPAKTSFVRPVARRASSLVSQEVGRCDEAILLVEVVRGKRQADSGFAEDTQP